MLTGASTVFVVWLLAFAGAGPVQQIISTGKWARNATGSDVLLCTSTARENGFYFRNVQVHSGAVIQFANLIVVATANTSLKLSFDNSANSAPFYSCSDVSNRPSIPNNATIAFAGKLEWNVTQLVAQIVAMPGWSYGNSMMLIANYAASTYFGIIVNPMIAQAVLQITYTTKANVTLAHASTVIPLSGNWSSNLDAAVMNSNLSIGVSNVSIVPSVSGLPINVSVTGTISNNMSSVACTGPPTSISENITRQHVCQFPCAPGRGYRLVLNYCWAITANQTVGNLTLTHQLNGTGCWSEILAGTINFPDPAFLPGTLLPDDGRLYPVGAGQLSSNASSQPLNSRDLFNAIVGVQHFCPGPWVTLWLESAGAQVPCMVQAGRAVTPPQGAVDDYFSLQFIVPPCNQTTCPGENPMFLTMKYANLNVTTLDSLVTT